MIEAIVENGIVVNIIMGHIEGSRPIVDEIPLLSENQLIDGFGYDIQAGKVLKVYKISEVPSDVIAAEKFQQFKKEQASLMEAAWDAGVVTSIEEIHMQAGQVDQDKIAAGLVSQQNKINIGKATLFDTVTVRDINNVNHEVTIQDFMTIVADVAEYVENLQYEYWAAVDGWTGDEI